MDPNRIKQYDELVAQCPRFERKGKTVPYTSANGHMFSMLNKDGELGIRFSAEVQKKYLQELNTTLYHSHGAVMRGYVLIPEDLWNKPDLLVALLNESHAYVLSLEPK